MIVVTQEVIDMNEIEKELLALKHPTRKYTGRVIPLGVDSFGGKYGALKVKIKQVY